MTDRPVEPLRVDTVVLDVDGTLVDTNYLHTVAWLRAFRAAGRQVPAWRIHRAIGMGGDRLVAAVAGDDVEHQDGDRIRDLWEQEYDGLLDEVAVFDGAVDLLEALRSRGLRIVLASSGIQRHTERAIELLDADRLADAWTTSDDAESSKPDPELIEVAVAKVDGSSALLVGDSRWDVEAATHAGVPTVALLTGGSSRAELDDAGAAWVFEGPADFLQRLDAVIAPPGDQVA
jgi:HAD superfamily hydrolase (TIGR01549 family)